MSSYLPDDGKVAMIVNDGGRLYAVEGDVEHIVLEHYAPVTASPSHWPEARSSGRVMEIRLHVTGEVADFHDAVRDTAPLDDGKDSYTLPQSDPPPNEGEG